MKIKTSITLSEEVVKAVDQCAKQYSKNRSEFIEMAVSKYIKQLIRDEMNAKDLEIINQIADTLNEEAIDVLAYQVPL
jgi:metal-responsive CopG/Arc/MetJ family transcriptional regulator